MKRALTTTLAFMLALSSAFSCAKDDPKPNVQRSNPTNGYVYCASRDSRNAVPILLNVCGRVPAGNLTCGQEVVVLEKQGPWMKITMPDGIARFIDASSLSASSDGFVPFNLQSGIKDIGEPNCPVHTQANTPPRAVYAPDPEYSDEGRKANAQGFVPLAVTVGTDGKPHEIVVEKKLGHGLDEKAVDAVRQWRFEPATIDGKPVEAKIHLSIAFRLYKYK